jgi:beta-galactosidase
MKNNALFKKLLIAVIYLTATHALNAQHTFTLGDTVFLLDGKPFQMISGEMHYPRIPKECWRARMKAAKAMGLNTIATYMFWNLHEPQKENLILKAITILLNLSKLLKRKAFG